MSMHTHYIVRFTLKTQNADNTNGKPRIEFVKSLGFARIHVFPFSAREGTRAAAMPDQVPKAVREARVKRLIQLGEALSRAYIERLVGNIAEVLFEEYEGDGAVGYTKEYVRVIVRGAAPGEVRAVRIVENLGEYALGEM